jgi:hypothetical protein
MRLGGRLEMLSVNAAKCALVSITTGVLAKGDKVAATKPKD